jgi:hypothetical protein
MKSFMNSIKDPLNIFLAIFCLILLFYVLGMYQEGFSSSEVLGYGTNYNMYAKSININGNEIVNIIFTADNGNSAEIIYKDNTYVLITTDEYGNRVEYVYTPTTTTDTTTTDTTDTLPIIASNATFVGTNGGSAKLIKLTNGSYIIEVSLPNGTKIVFVSKMNDPTNNQNQVYSNQNYMAYSSQPQTYSSQPQTYSSQPQTYSSQPQTYSTQPQTYSSQPQTYNQNYNYSNDLPEAIPASKIPPGHEDLYILKSEIVPPVCPACPSPLPCIKNKTDSCAPCPPCGRCPEPSFECKKVPNYSSTNYDIPDAILSPYSTFGT